MFLLKSRSFCGSADLPYVIIIKSDAKNKDYRAFSQKEIHRYRLRKAASERGKGKDGRKTPVPEQLCGKEFF